MRIYLFRNVLVLIESDWNLKTIETLQLLAAALVLIESDWNLKHSTRARAQGDTDVLIESDWNLKLITAAICSASLYRINRIRLEFKVLSLLHIHPCCMVLIESDWNLKLQTVQKFKN